VLEVWRYARAVHQYSLNIGDQNAMLLAFGAIAIIPVESVEL
jgi:hypothetical protein